MFLSEKKTLERKWWKHKKKSQFKKLKFGVKIQTNEKPVKKIPKNVNSVDVGLEWIISHFGF